MKKNNVTTMLVKHSVSFNKSSLEKKMKNLMIKNVYLDVGFVGPTFYPSGESVSEVAKFNIIGTKKTPSRDFFNFYIKNIQTEGIFYFRKYIYYFLQTGVESEAIVQRLGMKVKSILQMAITDLRYPPNAPSTIKRKKSSNPLIDTGLLRQSIDWRVFYG